MICEGLVYTHPEEGIFHSYYAICTVVVVFFIMHGHDIRFSLIHLADTIVRLVRTTDLYRPVG